VPALDVVIPVYNDVIPDRLETALRIGEPAASVPRRIML
jgi:hypothetical protein